jgi:tripartite-type tricarboxylate transporter receptor subunit TctC
MKRPFAVFVVLVLGVIFLARVSYAHAQEDFYNGKTLRIIVGFAPGGGYDTFTRTVARHMDEHIPGQPTIVVENMKGAGSLVAGNYLYNRADSDGLTAGVFSSGLVTQQAMDSKGIKFDARRFGWIGSMSKGTPVCAVMAFTGLKTLDDMLASKRELKMGSTGPGTTTHDLTNLMIGLMGAPFKVIAGYGGTAEVRLAMQRGEIDGACWTWESMRTTARTMLDAKGDDRLIPFVIQGKYDDPLVKGLPQFTEAIQDKQKLAAFKAWLAPYDFFRPIALPPGTASQKVDILRAALKKTMADPAFLADAEKAKLDVHHTSGETIENEVTEVLELPQKSEQLLASLIGR